MKVRELIKILSKLDPDSNVGICEFTNTDVVDDFKVGGVVKFYKYSSKRKQNLVFFERTETIGYKDN